MFYTQGGKTTIIEALKYALSGSMPPGGTSRSAGQVFVHDPRVIDATTVKAVVKLRFTNKAGKSQVVIRSRYTYYDTIHLMAPVV